jgi:hypothetical protein
MNKQTFSLNPAFNLYPMNDLFFLLSETAFQGFGHVQFAYGGLILGLSQFTQLPQLPVKMTQK